MTLDINKSIEYFQTKGYTLEQAIAAVQNFMNNQQNQQQQDINSLLAISIQQREAIELQLLNQQLVECDLNYQNQMLFMAYQQLQQTSLMQAQAMHNQASIRAKQTFQGALKEKIIDISKQIVGG